MSKTDLRVIKTNRAIKKTFLKQICTKPVNRITISGLASDAEINKGTFYLHYTDIYALYDELLEEIVSTIVEKFNPYSYFFTNPEMFVRQFLFSHIAPPSKEEAAMLREENLRFTTRYPALFVDAFRNKIYEVGKLTQSRENDIKLEYAFNGMLALLIKPGLISSNPSDQAFVVNLLAGSIRQLFSEYFSLPD